MGVPMSTGMARLGISSDNNNGNNIDANVITVEDTLTSARIALPRAVCISAE
jgi:hypothetical protein